MNKQLVNIEKLQETLDLIDRRQLMNGTILVAQNNQIIAERAFGLADLEENRPLTKDSLFNLASVSKPITATAILALIQQGKLRLEDDINDWLTTPFKGITIKHLLNHTSGLPDYMALFAQYWDRAKVATNSDLIDLFEHYRPKVVFNPNERLEYSNTGYIFLALIVEAVSQLPFAKFLQQAIFTPLKMTKTRSFNYHLSETIPDNFAHGYVPDIAINRYNLASHLSETSEVFYLDGMEGDGSIISTVGDLYRFERALNRDGFINADLLKEAYTKTAPEAPTLFNYGFGWIIEEDPQFGKTIFHTGGWPGYSTLLKYYADHDLTLIILRNKEMGFATENIVEAAIEQVIFNQPYELPEKPAMIKKTISLTRAECLPFCGLYQVERDDEIIMIKIAHNHEQLTLQVGEQAPFVLYPIHQNHFMIRGSWISYQFIEENQQTILLCQEDDYLEKAIKIAS